MSEQKVNLKHFQFQTTPQRLKKEILTEYETLKAKPKKTDQDKLFIQMVESKMKTIKLKLIGTHLPTKVQKQWILDATDFKADTYAEELVKVVRGERENKKKAIQVTKKMFEGAPYETIGGVMMKENLINEIAKRTTTNDPLKSKSPRKPKVNYIGVELEFNSLTGEDTKSVAKALVDAGLGRYVCVGIDGSCGLEVRVLLEEDNFVKPLTDILAVLNAKGFKTDDRCGTHVHLDMRNRDVKKCYKNFFVTQSFLRKFLNTKRKRNDFCKRNTHDNFDAASEQRDRYQGINTHSYPKYKTIEIRMHQGTLDAATLIPWIKLLVKIANFQGELATKVVTLKQASRNYNIEPELFNELQGRLMNRTGA